MKRLYTKSERTKLTLSAMLVAVLLALGAASCGDDDTATTATQTDGRPGAEGRDHGNDAPKGGGDLGEPDKGKASDRQGKFSDTSASFTPVPHNDSGGGSKQLRIKGSSNSVQEFGAEASGSEFDQAAAALHGYLDARAQGAWAAACSYLSAEAKRSIERQVAAVGGPPDCAQFLASISTGIAGNLRAEAKVADVGSLRTEGDKGFLLYRGTLDRIFAVAVEKEAGGWKVASLVGLSLT